MTDPLVSLIIVNYNSGPLLARCCESLQQTDYAPFELIIIDNDSHDNSMAQLPSSLDIRVIRNNENRGFGRACNQGAALAGGEFLVFLNPDVTITPHWLAILIEHMREQPEAAIICPTTLFPGDLPLSAEQPVERTAAVPGAAMLVRRTAWEALGGFDETIFLYWEDTDLCWRAWLAGWQVLADLHAQVYHQRGGSGGGSRWAAEQTKNGIYTYLKLMRWQIALRFVLEQAAKTGAKLALGRGAGLIDAWRWNWRTLPLTLAKRREVQRGRRGDIAALETLIAAHRRRQRREHRARRAGS